MFFSAPNVPLFPGMFLLNIFKLLLLVLLAYFNVWSNENRVQQDTLQVYNIIMTTLSWLHVAVLLIN